MSEFNEKIPEFPLSVGDAVGAVAPLNAGNGFGELTSPNIESVPEVALSFWMDGDKSRSLCRAARAWFQILADATLWPARQLNPLDCPIPILDLIAWQRSVKRYAGESERLYRLRVAHAFANARDSGQTAGWQRIFQRLEIGDVTLMERVPGQDWDRVGIGCDDAQFPDQQNVLEIVIENYGRTCRRYYFDSRIKLPLTDSVSIFHEDHCTLMATPEDSVAVPVGMVPATFDHMAQTLEARA